MDDVAIYGVALSAKEVASLATTIPLGVKVTDDLGGPDALALSLTSAASTSKGLQAHGNELRF